LIQLAPAASEPELLPFVTIDMTNPETTLPSISACRSVHTEDLQVGDYVTVLQRTFPVGTFAWYGLDTHQYPPEKPIEVTYREDFMLLKIKDVCLPFVLCTNHDGNVQTFDARATEFGRVAKGFADNFLKLVKEEKRRLEKPNDKKKKSKSKRKSKKRK
jgi:hypothetical protein